MGGKKERAKKMRQGKVMDWLTKPLKENEGRSVTSNATGSSAKTPIASNRSVFKDVGNTPMRSAQITQGTSKISDVKSEEDKEIEFKFITNGVPGQHAARGKASESLYSALMSMDIVKELKEKNQKKELHLVDLHGKTAFNLGMPLKCLQEVTTFVMRFYPFGGPLNSDKDSVIREKYRTYDAGDKQIVKFFVNTRSNQKILFSTALPKYIHSVCVFGVGGESFCDAICKDGRFLPTLETTKWKMEEGNEVFLSKYPVDKYANRTFSVKFPKKGKKKSSHATANPMSENLNSPTRETLKSFSPSLLDQYPCLQEQGTLIEEVLRAEAETQNTSPKALLKFQKLEFGKKTVNSTAARVIKMLADRLDSVGWIVWDNQGNSGSGTCFVLSGSYILTCHHVIRMMVGDGVEERDWGRVIGDVAKVTFKYEELHHPPRDSFYSIEPGFAVAEKNLDYALLKLQESHNPIPKGLIGLISNEPFNGLVYLIGHPGNQEKTTDACTVIPFFHRHAEISKRLHGEQLLHMFSPSSFWQSESPSVLAYDTSFFHGSSGSPVFNSSGRLVAMHSTGYAYSMQQKPQSVIEFGWLLKEICSDIENKDKHLYDLLLKEDSMKNKDIYNNDECNDVTMDIEETAEGCPSGEAMEEEDVWSRPRKRKLSNLPE